MKLESLKRQVRTQIVKDYFFKNSIIVFGPMVILLSIAWGKNQHDLIVAFFWAVPIIILALLVFWVLMWRAVGVYFSETAQQMLEQKEAAVKVLGSIEKQIQSFKESVVSMASTINAIHSSDVSAVRVVFSHFCAKNEKVLNDILTQIDLLPERSLRKTLRDHIQTIQVRMSQYGTVLEDARLISGGVQKFQKETFVQLNDCPAVMFQVIEEYVEKFQTFINFTNRITMQPCY